MEQLILEIKRSNDPSYDFTFNLWNEELLLYGEGNTLIDALKDFTEVLENEIEFFTKGKWEEYNDGAKELKRLYHSFKGE